MRVGNYWRPTNAAAIRLAEIGLTAGRGEAPNAHLYLEAELPGEFVIVKRGSPACCTLVGVDGEPVVEVMRLAERIARERKELRSMLGRPWAGGAGFGQINHYDKVAIEALKKAGCEQPSYKGETLPWWHHEWFAAVRGAAFRATL